MSATQAVSEAAPSAAAAKGSSMRRVLAASLIGTAVEYFDFFIYGTAASLVLGPLYFPDASPSAQLLSAYATFAVAFFARPLGAAFFGHFGDRLGRKSMLTASLLVMGLSTVLIGLLPTYAQIGWWAPALLCLLRFGQGLGLGGEWCGASLLAIEHAPPGHRSRFGMVPQLGVPVGFIAANGLFLILGLLLTPEEFRAWGWRLPFLASAVLVVVGLWIRLKLAETPAFKAALAEAPPPRAPLREVLANHPLTTLGGAMTVIACFASFYLMTTFVLAYGVGTLRYDREAFLGVELVAIVFLAGGVVASGAWSDAASPRRALMAGCAATVITGLLMPAALESGSLLIICLYLSTALFVMGFVTGPLGPFLSSLYPTRVRYTGTAVAHNLGGVIGGGLAPIIAAALAQDGGLAPVGVYLAGAALLSLVALILLARRPRLSSAAA
ncbi:MFS transporter [Phenylobacterium sp. LjRoot225]|uniref:MFS transporter n=1 Tax=Phenylobacterium sp. LjRoot225 TaxID=3342285 RepID=UPI003ECE956D